MYNCVNLNLNSRLWRLSKVRTGSPFFGNFFNGFANAYFARLEWVQFALQNCGILHSARGLYDKNSASWYYSTSDVMYKRYKRLVYTSPDLLARFCKVNLSNAKNSAWFVSLMYCEQEPLWLWVHIRLSSRCKISFTLSLDCLQIIFL